MEFPIAPKPLIGSKLPDMELSAFHQDKILNIHLADYLGKWLVLFFYPADFTFVCPTELQELASLYPEFQKINAEIISLSTDTAYSHKAWHEMSPAIKTVSFPMAADTTGALSKYLGIYIGNDGLSLRGTFILNPEGEIKSMEVNDNSIGRSGKELLRKLQAAQYVAIHTNEVCPASWQPGAQTLTPSDSLVGKI